MSGAPPSPDRSMTIEGSVKGSVLVTGDNNTVTLNVFAAAAAVETPAKATGANPYLGLLPFTEDDADRFFGREALVENYYARFRDLNAGPFDGSQHRLLAILGPSGSGKSSLARAGLLARLRRQPLGGGPLAALTPGAHPLEALAIVLARVAAAGSETPSRKDEFLQTLTTPGADGVYDGLRRIAADIVDATRKPLVLLIDQFEEIYTARSSQNPEASDAARKRFVETVLNAARDPDGRVSIILTMRSDFLGATQADGALNKVITSQSALAMVPAMSREELRSAIAKPAEHAGSPLDENTISRLVNETDGYDGALPLLQFVLVRAWQGMAAGRAAADVVEELGGVGGALGAEAEALYQNLQPREGESPPPQSGPNRKPNERLIAERAFMGMVRFNEHNRPTRRRAALTRLVADDPDVDDDLELAEVRGVLEKFADPLRRLVTFGEEDGVQTVEVTHEALFQHWARLKTWLADGLEDRRLHDRIADAAELWDQAGRPEGSLWRPPDLDRMRTLAAKPAAGLTAVERAFFTDSAAAHDREIRATRRREWFVRISAAVFLVLAVWIYWEKGKADRAIETAGDATNNLSHTLVEQLSGVEGTQDIRSELHDVVKRVESLLMPGTAPEASRGAFWDHIIEGRVAAERNQSDEQVRHAREALKLARRMSERHPSNLEWRRNVVIALEDSAVVGTPERTTALNEAVKINREILRKAESQRRQAENLHHYRHDLMGSLWLLGAQHVATGQYPAATVAFREALGIADQLVATHRQNRTYPLQAASIRSAYAENLRREQRYDDAYAQALGSKTILTALNRADPSNAIVAAALAEAGHGLAEIQLDRHDARRDNALLAAARAESDSAMAFARQWLATQPDRLQWQLMTLRLETQRADIELLAGQMADAQRWARAATDRAKPLESMGGGADWRRTLALAYQRQAVVELAARAFPAARAASDQSLQIIRQLKSSTADDMASFDLVTGLGTRGEIEWRAGALPAATAAIGEALKVALDLRAGAYADDAPLARDIQRLSACQRDIALGKAPGTSQC